MRKIIVAGSVFAFFMILNACKKSDSGSGTSNARTVQNFSGSYNLTALSVTYLGLSINLFDSLPACEQDNIIQLNTNLTAQFIDAGVQCTPPSDSSGVWSLSSNTDSIYLAGTGNLIQSWDGKTLVLAGTEVIQGLPFASTTTLVKKNN